MAPDNVPDPPANVQRIKKWVSGPTKRSLIVFDFWSRDECKLFIWIYNKDWGDRGKSARRARASSMSSIVVSSQTTVNDVNDYIIYESKIEIRTHCDGAPRWWSNEDREHTVTPDEASQAIKTHVWYMASAVSKPLEKPSSNAPYREEVGK